MFLNSEKIYNVFEKPEAAEPTDRVLLLKEGFTFWAFVFGPVWFLAKRLWVMFFGFLVMVALVRVTVGLLDLPMVTVIVAALFLHVMLGYHANDLRACALKRKGYRFAGVLAAESPMHAQRRYYEFAA